MSYENEVSAISALGRDKALAFRATRLKSLVGGMQAGAYVGIALSHGEHIWTRSHFGRH